MKSNEKVNLTKNESFYHYKLSFILITISLICLGFWVHGSYFESGYHNNSEDFLYFFIGSAFLSILFFYLSKQKLYFTEYKTNISEADLKKAIVATSKELNWQTIKLEKDHFIGRRFPEPYGNGNERIEIRKIDNRLLANSIDYPDYFGGSFIRKRNKENIRCFFNNCIQILKGTDIEEVIEKRQFDEIAEFWKESEWTFLKTIKRIVGYGLALLFLSLGLLLIFEGEFLGILQFGFAFFVSFKYIRNDLKILRTKRQLRKKRGHKD